MDRNVIINTLVYGDSVVGYRLTITYKGEGKFYDIDVESAEKYGLAKGIVGVKLPLKNYKGVLMTAQEREYNHSVKDMSNNVEFLKDIKKLISRVRPSIQVRPSSNINGMSNDKLKMLVRVIINTVTSKHKTRRYLDYVIIPLNLNDEISKVLVSQGIFSTDKTLISRLRDSIEDYLSKVEYVCINKESHTVGARLNDVEEYIIDKVRTKDVIFKKIDK